MNTDQHIDIILQNTPDHCSTIAPRLYCATAFPCSANGRHSRNTVAKSPFFVCFKSLLTILCIIAPINPIIYFESMG